MHNPPHVTSNGRVPVSNGPAVPSSPPGTPRPRLVPVRGITADPGVNLRAEGTCDEVAREYAAVMEAGGWLWDRHPLPVLFLDRDGVHWLADGFTRRRACELADVPSMPCEVRPGGRREAALWAASKDSANRRHGRRATREDLVRAVELVWAHAPNLSDVQVAKHVGVGPTFVGDLRRGRERSNAGQHLAGRGSDTPGRKIECADGKLRTPPRQAPKAGAPADPTKFGGATLSKLPGGRLYPRELMAQQFTRKHVALFETRLEEFADAMGADPRLAGLTDVERHELLILAQRTFLPEIYATTGG